MQVDCDVLVIGSGAAGLIAAIELANQDLKVIVATKDAVTESSSSYAQGGIAVPLAVADSVEKHIEDTLRVGQGLCDKETVELYISSIEKHIHTLLEWGIPFSGMTTDGMDESKLSFEAAHSQKRILQVGKDMTGRVLMKSLWEIACRKPNLSISQGTALVELLQDKHKKCVGGIFQDINNSLFAITAGSTIMASGGVTSLYSKATTPFVITGDGIACAYKVGAEIKDLDFIQFHPTALDHQSCFLLSETLRGEGAILLNAHGERFMAKYSPENLELSSRHIVSRAVWAEIKLTGKVYLDATGLGQERLKTKFKGIYDRCLELGYDMAQLPVPVSPAAHYTIGGIKVNKQCRSSVPGLWAVGEVANTGLHGADRLASNSLLECIVSGFLAARDITSAHQQNLDQHDFSHLLKNIKAYNSVFTIIEYKVLLQKIQEMMWEYASIERDPRGLNFLLNFLKESESNFPPRLSLNPFVNQIKNVLITAQLLVETELKREIHKI